MRLQAWRECSAQRGWEISTVRMSSWDAADAYSSARELFAGMAKEKLPTAIVTSNDLQAFGVCKALYELGIHVPQDVSVVGFDDMPGSDFHIPALTTVRPDFEALGRSAMQELLGMLGIPSDGGTVPTREAAEGNILIPAELVVRETSAAPR